MLEWACPETLTHYRKNFARRSLLRTNCVYDLRRQPTRRVYPNINAKLSLYMGILLSRGHWQLWAIARNKKCSESELFMYDVRVFLILFRGNPHLERLSIFFSPKGGLGLTFLKVLRPAKIEPPIHVEYLRSGGAYILILTSFKASFLTSFKRRSPKPTDVSQLDTCMTTWYEPRHRVLPPLRTMFEKRLFLKSRSTRFIESTTTWWTPTSS